MMGVNLPNRSAEKSLGRPAFLSSELLFYSYLELQNEDGDRAETQMERMSVLNDAYLGALVTVFLVYLFAVV